MKVCDVPYDIDMFWKGNKYVQFIKAKAVKSGAWCYKKNDPSGPTVWFPKGRKVKPVLRPTPTTGEDR